MAKRWSPQRRDKAAEMLDEGKTAAAVAKELDLPVTMVKEFKATLDKAGEMLAELHGIETDKKPATKKTTKKTEAPAKKPASKKATTKRKSKKKDKEPPSKGDRISQLIESVNATFDAPVVRRANVTSTDYLLRRPTGILSLDIGLAGGWPAGAMSLITGPDGAGKDFLLNISMAQQQAIQGDDFACFIYSTEFKFDKQFARDLAGFRVRMTNEEIDSLNVSREDKGLPRLTDEEVAYYQEQIGEVLIIDGVIADDGLDACLDAVRSNEFQIVAINSLGVFQTAAKETAVEKEGLSKHAIQSNEAQLLSRFMPALFMNLNREDDLGRRNYTTVLATNQVRANRDQKRPMPGRTASPKSKYVSGSGSRALAHGKAFELMLHKGPDHIDKQTKPYTKLGREVQWETLKAKLGTHEGKAGMYDYWYDSGADVLEDLINTAVKYEVIVKSSSWYSHVTLDDEEVKSQGTRDLRVFFGEHPEEVEAVRRACFREAGVNCIYATP